MEKKVIEIKTAGQLLLFTIVTIGLVFASFVFQLWLWKIIMVAIFGLPMLTFWQMVGLNILIWSFTGHVNPNLIKIKYEGEEY